jgi:hypothetical protein
MVDIGMGVSHEELHLFFRFRKTLPPSVGAKYPSSTASSKVGTKMKSVYEMYLRR